MDLGTISDCTNTRSGCCRQPRPPLYGCRKAVLPDPVLGGRCFMGMGSMKNYTRVPNQWVRNRLRGQAEDSRAPIRGAEIHVLNAIMSYGQPCCASFQTIASETNYSRRHVIRMVKRLQLKGYLEVEKKGLVNFYRVVMTGSGEWSQVVTGVSPPLVTGVSPPSDRGVTTTSDRGVTQERLIRKTHKKGTDTGHAPGAGASGRPTGSLQQKQAADDDGNRREWGQPNSDESRRALKRLKAHGFMSRFVQEPACGSQDIGIEDQKPKGGSEE